MSALRWLALLLLIASVAPGAVNSRTSVQVRSKCAPSLAASKWTTTYYVDSAAGSDAANGLTTGTAWQTIAKVVAVVGSSDNIRIRLKCGSSWREMLQCNGAVRVDSYSTGARPILDGADVIASGWSKTGGQTFVYQLAKTGLSTAANNVAIWEDGVRLVRATSIANCDATDGSFYCPLEAAMVLGGAYTMYVHATGGGNCASNGKTYEITARLWSCSVGSETAPGAEVYGIECRRGGHHNGPLEVGRNCYVSDCVVRFGEAHGIYIDSGTCANSRCYDIEFGFDFVANKGSSSDGFARFVSCTADINQSSPATYANNGFFAHGNTIVDMGYLNCVSAHHKVGFGFDEYNAGGTLLVKNCVATCPTSSGSGCKAYEIACETSPATLTVTMDHCSADMDGSFLYSFSGGAGQVTSLTKCSMLSRGTADVAIRSKLQTVNVDQCTFVGAGSSYGVAYIDTGTLTFNRSILTGYANPIQTFSGVTYTGNNNVEQGGSAWRYNGTVYVSYATWKTATSQDANTSTSDPLFASDPTITSCFAVQGGSPAVSRSAGCVP